MTDIDGSPAGAQLVIRCKDCRSQGNICKSDREESKRFIKHSLVATVYPPALAFDFEAAEKRPWQSVVRLDCRNVEPIEFVIKKVSNFVGALITSCRTLLWPLRLKASLRRLI